MSNSPVRGTKKWESQLRARRRQRSSVRAGRDRVSACPEDSTPIRRAASIPASSPLRALASPPSTEAPSPARRMPSRDVPPFSSQNGCQQRWRESQTWRRPMSRERWVRGMIPSWVMSRSVEIRCSLPSAVKRTSSTFSAPSAERRVTPKVVSRFRHRLHAMPSPLPRYGRSNRAAGRKGRADSLRPIEPVSSRPAIGTPRRKRWQPSRGSRGPLPASTTGPDGTTPDRSRMSAPPAPMTPGSVQPRKGTGRSIAPVAAMMHRARASVETPFRL